MALTKDIYTKAKQYFQKDFLNSFNPKEPLIKVNSDENLYAIACSRYLTGDKTAYYDPEEQKQDYENFVKTLRLNDFKASGKQIDVGVGFGSSNNLLYKLAVKFLQEKGEDLSKIKAKLTVINKAYEYPDFEGSFLRSSVLASDLDTFECVTKQTFYKWHYSTYVANTALEDKIRQENAVDFSSLGWDSVKVQDLTSRAMGADVNASYFISRSGSPFNLGYPVFCAVFEVGGISNLEEFDSSNRLTEIETKIEEQVSSLFNRVDASNARVTKFTHYQLSTKNAAIVRDISVSKGGKSLIRFCVAYDYAKLVLTTQNGPQLSDFLSNAKQELIKQKNFILTFNSTTTQQTNAVIRQQAGKIASILRKKNQSVLNGPPVFFDTKDPSLAFAKETLKKQGLAQNSINSILESQYILNLENISDSLQDEYNFLIGEYEKTRNSNPFFRDYQNSKVTEDISFYYDQSFQLLAITANRKLNDFSVEYGQQTPQIQGNAVPFEFELDEPLSNLDYLYSLQSEVELAPEPISGLDGDLALITQAFYDTLSEQDKKELRTSGLLISNQHYQDTIRKNSQHPPALVTSTINGFFYNSNEIILIEEAPKNPSFSSDALQKGRDGSIIDFLTSKQTYQQYGAIFNTSIDQFILRYHYPKVVLKPSFGTKAVTIIDGVPTAANKAVGDLSNVISKAKRAVKTGKDLEKAGKKGKKEEAVAELIKQSTVDYIFSTKDNLVRETQKQIAVKAAATSRDPRLRDLSSIIQSGDLDTIYKFILTKFDWGELLSKQLQENLQKATEVIGDIQEAEQEITNTVNNCLDNLGSDILETIANYKNAWKNIEKFIDKDVKDLVGLKDELPYLFTFDLYAFVRDKIEEAVETIIIKAIGEILASVIFQLQKDAEKFFSDSLDVLEEEFTDGLNLGLTGNQPPVQDTIGSKPQITDGRSLNIVEFSIIDILKSSNLEPLTNILEGATELLPVFATEAQKLGDTTSLMENYLNLMSDNITVPDFQNLLQGVVTNDIRKLNRVIVEDLNIVPAAQEELTSEINTAALFIYLSQFIENTVLNSLALRTAVRGVDSCFVKLTSEPANVLADFVLTTQEQEQTVLDRLNSITDQINKACQSIESALNAIDNSNTSDLLDVNDKKELLDNTAAILEGVTTLPGRVTRPAFENFTFFNESENVLLGKKLGTVSTQGDRLNPNKTKLIFGGKLGKIPNILNDLNETTLKDSLKKATPLAPKAFGVLREYFANNSAAELSTNVEKFQVDPETGEKLDTPLLKTTRQGNNIILSVDGENLLELPFETYSFNSTAFSYRIIVAYLRTTESIKTNQFTALSPILPLTAEGSPQVTDRVKKELNKTLEESTEDSNFYTDNTFKMKQIIKKLKTGGEQ